MRKRVMVAVLCCAFALAAVLAGCGGGASSAAAAKEAWVGTWDLEEMDDNGEVTSAENIAALKELGLDLYLELDADGTSSLVMFGESMASKWEAKSATEAVLSLDGQNITMTMDGGKVRLTQDGSTLTFTQGEKRPSSASADSAESAASS